MVAPTQVRSSSAGRERAALLASSEKPTRLKTDTVIHQQNIMDAGKVSPAGNISATSKNRGINESGRFHLWQEVEQQFQQWQKQGGAHGERLVSVSGPGVGRPIGREASGNGGDLFGRSGSEVDRVTVATTEATPVYFESMSNGRGSGNLHSTEHLAGGVSEAETGMSPRNGRGGFQAQFSSRDVCRFHSALADGRSPRLRGAPEVKEMSKHAKDACRFHYHEKPARARSADVGSDARRTAGLTSTQRESRHGSGESHGRSMTPDYHQRYAENAGGSTLPGSTGASVEFGMTFSPRATGATTLGDMNRTSRRHGACDPRRTGAANLSASVVSRSERQGDLTASVHKSRACRYHAPPEEAAKFFRQSSQNNHVKHSALDSGPGPSPQGSPAATTWRSLEGDTSRSYDPSQSFVKSLSNLQNATTPRYVPGRMDRNTARASADRLLEVTRPKQALGDVFDRGPLLSLGGSHMSQKKRLNEGHVPAARMTSSPIASEGGIWA